MKPAAIVENKSLQELNWWKVGGTARFFAAPRSLDELKEVWRWAANPKISGLHSALKIWVISGGSNVLIQDGVLEGLVISMRELRGIEEISQSPDLILQCWAGTPKSDVAKIFLQKKLAPAIFLTGIPGDMGAGVVMNAGIGESRTPREFCEIVRSVEVLNYDSARDEFILKQIASADIRWEYRHSSGWQPGIVLRVTVGWQNAPQDTVMPQVREQTQKRVTTQPLNLPNCGSVFRNPVGHKSAQLIEQCGLKGFRVGGACVSTKHANFIVNDQGATARDVYAVIQHVRETVLAQTGVALEAEVVMIGDWDQTKV